MLPRGYPIPERRKATPEAELELDHIDHTVLFCQSFHMSCTEKFFAVHSIISSLLMIARTTMKEYLELVTELVRAAMQLHTAAERIQMDGEEEYLRSIGRL